MIWLEEWTWEDRKVMSYFSFYRIFWRSFTSYSVIHKLSFVMLSHSVVKVVMLNEWSRLKCLLLTKRVQETSLVLSPSSSPSLEKPSSSFQTLFAFLILLKNRKIFVRIFYFRDIPCLDVQSFFASFFFSPFPLIPLDDNVEVIPYVFQTCSCFVCI